MSLANTLRDFLREKLKDDEKIDFDEITIDTALISSKILNSLSLLALVVWIEKQIKTNLELTDINIIDAWNTQRSILDFIEKNKEPEVG